jgi:O-antigen/teichoic acid export membrane protein
VAVATMLAVVGEDALVALSGPDKAASGQVFVLVGTMLALYPLFDISAYGLLLRRRSARVFVITFLAAALNVAINLVMIPRYGFMGAAWATVISYGALCAINALSCPRGLLRFPDARTLATACGCALLLLAVAKTTGMFGVERAWLRLFVGGGLFLALYALPVWMLDPRLRRALSEWRTAKRGVGDAG